MGIENSYNVCNYSGMKKPNNIKKLRKAKGWTLKQLGDKVGVHKSYVTRWENYDKEDAVALTHRYIIELCKALDCTPDDIMVIERNEIGEKSKVSIIEGCLADYLEEKKITLSSELIGKAVNIIYEQGEEINEKLLNRTALKHDISLVVRSFQEK